MKRFLNNYCMALALAASVLGLGRSSQAQPCPINFPNPPGNVLTTYIVPYPNYPNSPATFSFTVGAGQPLFPGTYYGWCVDANTELDATQGYTVAGTTYTGFLLPDCDPNLNSELPPGHPATCYVSPAVWQEVNYLINHQNGAYFWNVQGAINTLVGGPPISGPGYPAYDTNVVAALVADASNNAATWVPQCGDLIGVIDVITNQAGLPLSNAVQFVMLEVTNCPVTFTSNTLSLLTNVDLGCNPNPATIPTCQNPVNTNLINATSCCGRPVTITCSESDSSVNCKNFRILTYNATDGYGNTATASQTITWIVDTNLPVITSVPTGTNLGCNPSLPTDASIKAQVTATAL